MSLVVVDASALTVFYTADDPRHADVRDRLAAGHALFAPAHVDTEVVSALRGLVKGRPDLLAAVPHALAHLAGLPIRRESVTPLLDRMWELRHNVTPYEAAYVALAERLDGPLLTCDAKLAAASGTRCRFDLVN